MKLINLRDALVIGLIAFAAGLPIVATAQGLLYGARTGKGTGEFGSINRTTGVFTSIGLLQDADGNNYTVTGLAAHPETGVIYGTTNNNSPTAKRSLIIIDAATGLVTLVGSNGQDNPGAGISFRSDGTLFGWFESTDELYTISLATGIASVIGGSLNTYGSGLAFDGLDNLFFAPTGDTYDGGLIPEVLDDGVLVTLDPATGAGTSAVALTGGTGESVPINSLAFDDLGTLFGSLNDGPNYGSTGNFLIAIDPNTGEITTIGSAIDNLNALVYFLGTPLPGTPSSPSTRGEGTIPSPIQTFLLTDIGAISGALKSGLAMPGAITSSNRNAHQQAIGDLNNRLFRTRSGITQGRYRRITSTLDSTSRYLSFTQNQNIDYRVALGLADGEEVELIDTLSAGAGHPFAMAGIPSATGSAVIAVEGGSGKNSVTDKVVIDDVATTSFEMFTEFDYGFYDQDNLTKAVRGFRSDSYAGSFGLEYKVTDNLVLGTAYTYFWSDTEVAGNLGNIDLEGNLVSAYATAFFGDSYVDVLYSYGAFNNELVRNTLMGRNAYGDAESQSHNVALNLGHNFRMKEQGTFGPFAGLDYGTGNIDGYTERGGRNANLIYPDTDFETAVGRLGGQVTFRKSTNLGMLTTQARAGWAHEFLPESDTVTATLQTSPFILVSGGSASRVGGFTAEADGAHAGTDWIELGLSSRLDIQNTGFYVELGYDGMFGRNNASGHFGSTKIGYEW